MRRNETRRDENDLTGNRVEKSVITDTNHDGTFSAATDRDSVTQYTQDANDRILSESTVVDGSATESTIYGYTGESHRGWKATGAIESHRGHPVLLIE